MKAKAALIAFLLFLFCFSFAKSALAAINFGISNPVISSSDEIEIDASISGLISSSCSTSGCYLQTELRVLDETKGFFGFTYNNSGDYVDYFSSPSSLDDLKTKLFNFVPASGAWSGKLKARNNPESTNYVGPGQYTIKFRRFSGNSTSATSGDSNAITVAFASALPTPTPGPTAAPTSTPTPLPTPSKTPTPKPSVSPTPIKLLTPTKESQKNENSSSRVLGSSTQNDTPTANEPSKQTRTQAVSTGNLVGDFFIILGIIFAVLCGIVFAWPYRHKVIEKFRK